MFSLSSISTYRRELMGVAIIHVLIIHAYYALNFQLNGIYLHLFRDFINLCETGTFFFLSGYGCFYSYSNHPSIINFYKNRAKTYIKYAIIGFPFFFYQDIIIDKSFNVFLLELSGTYLWIGGNRNGMWYIATILLLYSIFPIIYHFLFNKIDNCKIRNRFIILIISLLLLFFLSHIFATDYYSKVLFRIFRSILFIFGIYTAFLSKQNYIVSKNKVLILIIFSFTLSLIGIDSIYNILLPLLGIYIYIYLFHFLNENILSFLRLLGTHSLEIYLIHMLSIHIFQINGTSIFLLYFITILISSKVQTISKRIASRTINYL